MESDIIKSIALHVMCNKKRKFSKHKRKCFVHCFVHVVSLHPLGVGTRQNMRAIKLGVDV